MERRRGMKTVLYNTAMVAVFSLLLVWPIISILKYFGYHLIFLGYVEISTNILLIYILIRLFDLIVLEKGGEE